jgi:hypothetical protein
MLGNVLCIHCFIPDGAAGNNHIFSPHIIWFSLPPLDGGPENSCHLKDDTSSGSFVSCVVRGHTCCLLKKLSEQPHKH